MILDETRRRLQAIRGEEQREHESVAEAGEAPFGVMPDRIRIVNKPRIAGHAPAPAPGGAGDVGARPIATRVVGPRSLPAIEMDAMIRRLGRTMTSTRPGGVPAIGGLRIARCQGGAGA